MCLDLLFLFGCEISQRFVSGAVTHRSKWSRHLLTCTRHHIENELNDLVLPLCAGSLLSTIFVFVQERLLLSSIFEAFSVSGQSSKEERNCCITPVEISHQCWGSYCEVVFCQTLCKKTPHKKWPFPLVQTTYLKWDYRILIYCGGTAYFMLFYLLAFKKKFKKCKHNQWHSN